MSPGHAPFVILNITLEQEKVTAAKRHDWRGFSRAGGAALGTVTTRLPRTSIFAPQPLVHSSSVEGHLGKAVFKARTAHLATATLDRLGHALRPSKPGRSQAHPLQVLPGRRSL